MPTPQELEARLWTALKSDMTIMLGLVGVDDAHALPMTAQLLDDTKGPIYVFTSSENRLAANLGRSDHAVATFVSKGHDLFATIHGRLSLETDPAVVDALWNRFVAAWYEGGKTDPKLRLLKFDTDHAEIWLDASSLLAGIKLLLGADPKEEYRDNVAKVNLG